jgi:predicted DsbA family dithiol-disulfide isomerase
VFGALGQWAYVSAFPNISHYFGYGRVDDQRTRQVAPVSLPVTFYTAVGCPFCPLVERRLLALQKQMGFELKKIDITLRPQLLMERGIRAVPVVEAGGRRLVGHATTDQLAALLMGTAQTAPTAPAG